LFGSKVVIATVATDETLTSEHVTLRQYTVDSSTKAEGTHMGLAHGIVGWTDVAVPDMDAGKAFYGALFGWEAVDADGGESMPYAMFSVDGKLVAGMGPLSDEQASAGQPPAWSTYIIVDDVDAIHERAEELGATSLMEPMQIMDAGRMVFIIDPVGAPIGFWQSGTHDGAEVFNEYNTHSWNDLASRDVESAKAFYTELLGWETAEFAGEMTYTTFSNADRMTGGTYDMSGLLPDEVHAHWLTWFRVEDCAATAARVTELGGTVRREPEDTDAGISAVVSDPFGAVFAVIETDRVDGQPPR
jgi:predicted enzyme related to lactoylglutathione lyase